MSKSFADAKLCEFDLSAKCFESKNFLKCIFCSSVKGQFSQRTNNNISGAYFINFDFPTDYM